MSELRILYPQPVPVSSFLIQSNSVAGSHMEWFVFSQLYCITSYMIPAAKNDLDAYWGIKHQVVGVVFPSINYDLMPHHVC